MADFDNDGRLDLLVSNANVRPLLYRNIQPTGNHWVQFALKGTRSNTFAVGARLWVTSGGQTQVGFVNGERVCQPECAAGAFWPWPGHTDRTPGSGLAFGGQADVCEPPTRPDLCHCRGPSRDPAVPAEGHKGAVRDGRGAPFRRAHRQEPCNCNEMAGSAQRMVQRHHVWVTRRSLREKPAMRWIAAVVLIVVVGCCGTVQANEAEPCFRKQCRPHRPTITTQPWPSLRRP